MYGSTTKSRRRLTEETVPLTTTTYGMTPLDRWHNNKTPSHSSSFSSSSSLSISLFDTPKVLGIMFAALAVAFSWSTWWNHHHHRHYHTTGQLEPDDASYSTWDYNAYRKENPQRLLLTQKEDDLYATLTSLPNRAYARQWGRDYALVRPTSMTQFLAELQVRPFYDTVVVLSADSIIVDLDFDLSTFLSKGSMLALGNQTGTLFFRLRHPHAVAAIQQWRTVGSSNDFGALKEVVLENCGSDCVQDLVETSTGFVGDSWIKSVLPRSELLDQKQSTYDLSTAASAVCYRYYPKCEVL